MVVLSRPSILSLVLDISVDIDTEDGGMRDALLTNKALEIFLLQKSRAGLFQARLEKAFKSDFLGPCMVPVVILFSSLKILNGT